VRIGFIWLMVGRSDGLLGHSDEPSGSVKSGISLEHFSGHEFLKHNSVPWN